MRVGFKVKRSAEVGEAEASLIIVSWILCSRRAGQIVRRSAVARHSGFKRAAVSRTA